MGRLFRSTACALCLLAVGQAQAEVKLTTTGRLGLEHNFATSETREITQLGVEANAQFVTESGWRFTGRAKASYTEADGATLSGFRLGIVRDGLEIGFGNTNGAIEYMPNLYGAVVGLNGLGTHGTVMNAGTTYWARDHFSNKSSGVDGVELIWRQDRLGVHLSYSDPALSGAASARRVAGHVSYQFGDWIAAAALQSSSDPSQNKTILTLGGTVNGTALAFAAADNGGIGKVSVSAARSFGATTVNGFLAAESAVAVPFWGLGVQHKFNENITLKGGLANDRASRTIGDVGLSFSF